ncbi:helix-turn-helix domain-containing protein [Streptomyces sp. NBC_00341]|uniref:helix-turn-helix domain-containing protein n=1 Tax=Streptomyces sp. NBC_00341 TaxID=2975717 RepID=UPI003086DF51|nr:helix-turn-helix domain-containing protein [Streptomyces sp. NBC_00341]
MSAPSPALGAFLRVRRDALPPERAGLPAGTGRRGVPGLRREELAGLAGISPEYYTRLEQGRDRNPSPEILAALARALRLDPAATRHLHRLGGHLPPDDPAGPGDAAGRLPAGLRQLLTVWDDVPAVVQNAYLDVLAATPAATALAPFYRPGVNLLRAAFLGDSVRRRYRNAPELLARAVASLRAFADRVPDDPRLGALRDELTAASPQFRTLWERYEVSPPPGGTVEIDHPSVGPLSLEYQRFAVPGLAGTLLVVHTAVPGTPSEAALDRLVREVSAES